MGEKVRVIDLFAGCGGLTAGFHASGHFRTVAAVEHDLHAAATYAQNFDAAVHVRDIADWALGSVPRADVVVGGPPCQGFSALGKRDPEDPRNSMWKHYVEVLDRVRPAFFVLENVPGFLRGREFVELRRACEMGGQLDRYELDVQVLNAADFGTAQSRRRAVVIGRLRALRQVHVIPFGVPRPTLRSALPEWTEEPIRSTGLPASTVRFKGEPVPGAYKLSDLHFQRPPTSLALRRYQAIPPGGSRLDLPDELQMDCWRRHRSGAGDVMGRLDWARPAVTLRTEFFKPEKGRFLHPDQDRPITHAEAALIQGFPENFVWCGTARSIARQIGNAVPIPLAQSIAGVIGKLFA